MGKSEMGRKVESEMVQVCLSCVIARLCYFSCINYALCQAFLSVGHPVLALTQVAEFFLVFINEVFWCFCLFVFFRISLLCLSKRPCCQCNCSLYARYMSVENIVKFVTGKKMFVKEL